MSADMLYRSYNGLFVIKCIAITLYSYVLELWPKNFAKYFDMVCQQTATDCSTYIISLSPSKSLQS